MKKTTKKQRKKVVKPSVTPESQSTSVMNDQQGYPDWYTKKLQEANDKTNVLKDLTPTKLQEAIILSEILGKPVSKRRNRRRVGY